MSISTEALKVSVQKVSALFAKNKVSEGGPLFDLLAITDEEDFYYDEAIKTAVFNVTETLTDHGLLRNNMLSLGDKVSSTQEASDITAEVISESYVWEITYSGVNTSRMEQLDQAVFDYLTNTIIAGVYALNAVEYAEQFANVSIAKQEIIKRQLFYFI